MGNTARDITVMNGAVKLRQIDGGFKTSIDSVLLAAACPAQSGDTILDLGCGVGSASFCVLERVEGAHLTGIDLQGDHTSIARENAAMNNKIQHCTFIEADVYEFLAENRFNHVICNPPYLDAGNHTTPPSEAKSIAHTHREDTTLKDWIDTAYHNVKSRGSLTIIHRADHIDEIIKAMGKRFGAIEIIPLWPKAGKEARRVIVRAIKDRKSPATMHAGLVLHDKDGEYTPETHNILRGGLALL